jgi:zinc transport system ATP-binding protein
MTSPVLEVSHVSVDSPVGLILDDINLTVEAGHFMGIIGPNGAGKSTLLSVIAGLMPADRGTISISGEVLQRGNRRRLLKNINLLSQLHDAGPRLPLTVRQVVGMGLTDYVSPLWKRPVKSVEIMQTLELLDMAQMADRDFRMLSGGQRQRVRIARALVSSPRLLLLDEPSAALDTSAQESLYHLLRRLCDESGIAIIMVEHDIAAITSYVDSVACLNKRIHHHAIRGEKIPEHVWQAMYGTHTHIVEHDANCIGCTHGKAS